MSHTPGPWIVLHKRSIHPVGRDALAVAVAEQHDKNHEANARLIAAAPRMLAALLFVRNANSDNKHFSYECMTEINEAIAQATGGE